MMISSVQVQNLLAQYKNTKSGKGIGSASPVKGGKDEFRVSQDAQTFIKAKEAIRSTPDVRNEKVAALQQKIKTGSYSVSNEEIAEKMIERSLVDTLA